VKGNEVAGEDLKKKVLQCARDSKGPPEAGSPIYWGPAALNSPTAGLLIAYLSILFMFLSIFHGIDVVVFRMPGDAPK